MKTLKILEKTFKEHSRALPSLMTLQKQVNQDRSKKALQKRIKQAKQKMKSK